MVSFWDMLILLIVIGVIVFGADKIPELFRNLGRAVGEYKKARIEAEKELQEIEEEVKRVREELKS